MVQYAVDSDQEQRLYEMWLRDATKLPPVPVVLRQAIALLNDDRSRAVDVANVIGRDEAITAKLLRVVNSAFYGLSGKVKTISHAVALLGFQQVRVLVLGLALFEVGKIKDPKAAANRDLVWRHSISCAHIAQVIAKGMRLHSSEEAFVAGLLHDVGKVLLAVSAPHDFALAVEQSEREGIASCEAELALIGVSHVSAGVLVAGEWSFPTIFQNCIALHHSPWPPQIAEGHQDAKSLKRLLAIVRVADAASRRMPAMQGQTDNGIAGGAMRSLEPATISSLIGQVEQLLAEGASDV